MCSHNEREAPNNPMWLNVFALILLHQIMLLKGIMKPLPVNSNSFIFYYFILEFLVTSDFVFLFIVRILLITNLLFMFLKTIRTFVNIFLDKQSLRHSNVTLIFWRLHVIYNFLFYLWISCPSEQTWFIKNKILA